MGRNHFENIQKQANLCIVQRYRLHFTGEKTEFNSPTQDYSTGYKENQDQPKFLLLLQFPQSETTNLSPGST